LTPNQSANYMWAIKSAFKVTLICCILKLDS